MALAGFAGIAVGVAEETVAEQAVGDADLEEAWIAVLVPAGRRLAFAHVVQDVAGAEADAAAGVVCIGTEVAVVGPVAGAFASQQLLVGCRWEGSACTHSWAVAVVEAVLLGDAGVGEERGSTKGGECVFGSRVSTTGGVAAKVHDGGTCHLALEVKQREYPCVGTRAGSADDEASWHALVESAIRVSRPRRPPHRHHRRHPSCP